MEAVRVLAEAVRVKNIEAVRMFVKSKIGQIQAVIVLVEAVRVLRL